MPPIVKTEKQERGKEKKSLINPAFNHSTIKEKGAAHFSRKFACPHNFNITDHTIW
jgi:hypothetical protein